MRSLDAITAPAGEEVVGGLSLLSSLLTSPIQNLKMLAHEKSVNEEGGARTPETAVRSLDAMTAPAGDEVMGGSRSCCFHPIAFSSSCERETS